KAFDLLVDNKHRVEVKCGLPSAIDGLPTWRFNIHRHGVLNEETDFYILRLERVPYSKRPVHLLFQAPLRVKVVTVSLRSLLMFHSQGVADFYDFAHGKFSKAA